MDMRDAQRVQQVLAGDSAAYEGLVDAYKGRVYALVVGRLGDFSAAEDVVQDAFVEAYVNLKSLKSPEKFGAWLRGIAVNLANRWVGKRRPMAPLGDPNKEVSPDAVIAFPASPEQVYEDAEMKGAVLKAVSDLPEIYREAVLLHYMEDMTYGQIAAFLDVPESTVTGRLQVARNRLREGLMPLVSETLQEKRPTSRLTRKIMTALPPLLYAAAPSSAGFMTTLKGSAMFKMIGFLSAGIVGTGLYFGGIEKMVNWKGSAEQNSPADIFIEWVQDAEKDRDISVDNKYPAMESQNQGFSRAVQDNQAIGDATKSISDGTGGAGQMEKANFKLESSPQDSVVNMTYGLPASLYPDSVFVEVVVFNFMGAQVAKPVNGIHKPGTYTAHLHKRALPDGVYFFLLQLDRQNVRAVRRTLNLIWEDRK